MSTRCTVIDGGPFHLFIEAQTDELTVSIAGEENEYSGGTFVKKEYLVQFAKQVLAWSEGKEPEPFVYEDEE